MKIIHIFYVIYSSLFHVNHMKQKMAQNKIVAIDSSSIKVEPKNFFPVTEYIKGQVFENKKRRFKSNEFVTINNHTDSAWLKMEKLFMMSCRICLFPEIDTTI